MCVFCAAIPATLAVGAAATKQQREIERQTSANGAQPAKRRIPAGPTTALLVTGLLVCSVVYHTTQWG